MPINEDYLGYMKYEGRLVLDGYLDARKSAEALLGFDEAVRYFVGKQSQELSHAEYEVPVKVESGSWITFIPLSIGKWVLAALGAGAIAYVATAATNMAAHDFKDKGICDVFRKALQAIQWLIRIGKHLGTVSWQTFPNVQWRNGTEEIGIPNDAGELLFVPKEFFDLYDKTPANLLSRLARLVVEERTLVIGVRANGGDETVELSYAHRRIFCEDEEDVLFPDLEHGMSVTLEGLVTRGNESANTIGFRYNEHILTCYPKSGSIVEHKPALFLKCRISGVITRQNHFGEPIEPRPKIIFTALEPLEDLPSEPTLGLFDESNER